MALITLVASGKNALASAACNAAQAGGLNYTFLNSATTFGPILNGFSAGEVITATFTHPANDSSDIDILVGPPFVSGAHLASVGAGIFVLTYTVTGSSDTSVRLANGQGTGTATATCGTSPTNAATDSQKIRSVQIGTTATVANTSGQAITNAIDSGINDGFSNNGTPTGFGANGGFINFAAAEPNSETVHRAEGAISALAFEPNVYKATRYGGPIYKAQPRLEREWSVWADFRGTGWKINDNSGNGTNQNGSQLNVTAGVGRKLTTNTLVGMIVGYENFKYDVAVLSGRLKGDGETIGGYFAHKFGGNLRFDAALAWSHLNYNATAGTATGSFNGGRWLASTGITGAHKYGAYVIEPSAKLYVLWERQQAWTDSLGTLQGARGFSAGRTAVGTNVARPFKVANGWTLSPYAGLYADWRFQTANALPTGATPVANIGTGWSGRATTGLLANAPGGSTLKLDGDYGGLGASYKIWTGYVRGTVPF